MNAGTNVSTGTELNVHFSVISVGSELYTGQSRAPVRTSVFSKGQPPKGVVGEVDNDVKKESPGRDFRSGLTSVGPELLPDHQLLYPATKSIGGT